MSDPGQGRVFRSQSHLLREVQDIISMARKKPRVVEPTSADRIHIDSSARKLFTSPSTSTSYPLDIELDDVNDTSATPRAMTGGSLLEHFVPNPELFQSVASAAAGAAASGAARVATSGVARVASLLAEFGRSFDPLAVECSQRTSITNRPPVK